MSGRTTIVTVLIAVLSVVIVIFVREPAPPSRSAGDEGAAAGGIGYMSGLAVDAVTRITLRRAGEVELVFERDGAAWAQTSPFAHPMDPFSVRQLVVQASQVELAKRLAARSVEGLDIGLDPPRAVLAFEWPEGSSTLQLGRRAVAGRWYLRTAGKADVSVCRGDLYERAVEMDPKEWRDRTIFPGVSVDADEIVIADAAERIVLRRDRRSWALAEPVPTRLDGPARDELFSALGRAQSGGFILDEPRDLARFGLDEPVGTVTATMTRMVLVDDEPRPETIRQTLTVGARMGVGSEDRFGMVVGRPVVVRVPGAVVAALFRRATAFVDPTASGVSAPNVKSLVIRSPEHELRLERDLERWLAPRYRTEVPAPVVAELVDLLTARRAAAIEIRAYPQDLEVATVTLYGFDAAPLDTVRIARDPETRSWALENGDNVLRIFPAETRIAMTPADFDLEPGAAQTAAGTP